VPADIFQVLAGQRLQLRFEATISFHTLPIPTEHLPLKSTRNLTSSALRATIVLVKTSAAATR
jgi:hypothetical protein